MHGLGYSRPAAHLREYLLVLVPLLTQGRVDFEGEVNDQRVFEREGVTAPGDLALVGSESTVERQVRGYADAGATELWPVVFPVGPNPEASLRRTRELLQTLALSRTRSSTPAGARP